MEKHLLIAIVDALVSDAIAKLELREGPQGPRGLKGRDGIDFRLEENIDEIKNLILELIPKNFELTEDQISLLKGERGEKGLPGRNGKDGSDGKDFVFEEHAEVISNKINELCQELALKFEDLTIDQLESLRGYKGLDGKDGKDFVFEDHEEEISEIISKAVPKFEDLTLDQIESIRGYKGRDGKDGRSFVFEDHIEEISQIIDNAVPKFEDFTTDQIESLRGSQGQKGEAGKDFSFEDSREEINSIIISYFKDIEGTLKLKFEDLTEEDKESIRGPRGQRGKAGRDFNLSEAIPVIGEKVSEWLVEKEQNLKLHFSDLTEEEKDSLKLKFEHLTPEETLTLRGPRGQRGKMGIQGERGISGIDGAKGNNGKMGPQGLPGLSGKNGRDGRDGIDGVDGLDAPKIIDVKVDQNRRTQDFNLIFEMEDGSQVETPKIKLPKGDSVFYYPSGVGSGGGGSGVDGKSAYEIAVDNGFVGTEAEWLDSLNGSGGGGSVEIMDEYVSVTSAASSINFIGDNVTVRPRVNMDEWESMSDVLPSMSDYLGPSGNPAKIDVYIETFDPSLIKEITCDSDVYVSSFVRMDSSGVAHNSLADSYDNSNVIGIVESKPSSTKCNIRVMSKSSDIFNGLDTSLDYFLSDTVPGGMTSIPPTTSGHIKLKLGQAFSSSSFLIAKGERVVRA